MDTSLDQLLDQLARSQEIDSADEELLDHLIQSKDDKERKEIWSQLLNSFRDDFGLTIKESAKLLGISDSSYLSYRSKRRLPARTRMRAFFFKLSRFRKIMEGIIAERQIFLAAQDSWREVEVNPLKTSEKAELLKLLNEKVQTERGYKMLSSYLIKFIQLKRALLDLDLEHVAGGKAFKEFLLENDSWLFTKLAPIQARIEQEEKKAGGELDDEFWNEFLGLTDLKKDQ